MAAQTFTVPCPGTAEPTLAVLLYDNVMEETTDKSNNRLVMHIAEVVVYYLYAEESKLLTRERNYK